MLKITTPRLTLFPFDLIYVQMYLEGRENFQRMFPFQVPDSWPWKEMNEITPELKGLLLREPALACRLTWLIIHPLDRTLIGDIGFGGPPDAEGAVEISYNIVPEYRRRGYASEAADALVRWIFAQSDVRAVKAATWPDSRASMRVLEKIGMRRMQVTPHIVHWELERDARG